MTTDALITKIAEMVRALEERRATGRHIITFDMHNGGVGRHDVYHAKKSNPSDVLFIGRKGIVFLEKMDKD